MAYDDNGLWHPPQQGDYATGVTHGGGESGIAGQALPSGDPMQISPGKLYDPEAWGGYSGTVSYDANGQPIVDKGANGLSADTQRWQGMAAAAQQRKAYQPNLYMANYDRDQALQMRAGQQDAANIYRQTAMGQDSRAQVLGHQMLTNAAQQQIGVAQSTRGDALARANALQNVQNGQAVFMQQGNQALNALKQREMADAQRGYFAAGTQMRDMDQRGQGLSLEQAEMRARAEMAQRGLNDQASLGYEGMGLDARQASMQNFYNNMAISTGQQENQNAIEKRQTDREDRLYGAGASTAGTFLVGAADGGGPGSDDYKRRSGYSDERTKHNVRGLAQACAMRRR